MSPRTATRAALALLIVLTLALRFWGLDFLLPQAREPDAQLVEHLRAARGQPADEDSGYTHAYPYVLPYLVKLIPFVPNETTAPQTLDEHLARCARPLLEVRSLIALISVLSVPLTFALARRFVSDRWALFAAALAGVSFLSQWFSQEARPHAAASIMFLLAVVAALRLRNRPTWSSYILAGIAAAIAVGSLHSGVVVLAAGLAAHFTREGPREARDHLKLLAPIVALGLGLVLFYPFFFPWFEVGRSTPVEFNAGEVQFGRHTVLLEQFTFGGARKVARTLVYYEPALLVGLGLATAALFFARRAPDAHTATLRGNAIVVASYVIPYTLVLAMFDETFERFLTPLVPYLALAVTWGLSRWASCSNPSVRFAAVGASALVLGVETFGTMRLASLRAQPDTTELAARFVQAELKPKEDTLFLFAKFDLPIARTRDSVFNNGKKRRLFSRWAKYQGNRRGEPLPEPHWNVRFVEASPDMGYPTADSVAFDTLGFLRKLGPGIYCAQVESARGHPGEANVYAELQKRDRLARFAPHDSGPGKNYAIEFQDPQEPFPMLWWRIVTAKAIGPPIEIYRVDSW